MAKKKAPKQKSFYEIYQSIRRNWNGVNPVTKIERDRSKYTRKVKHKNRDNDI